MNWKKVKEIISDPISGEWGEEGNGIKVIRTTNFTNEGKLNLKDVVLRNVESKKIDKKKLKYGDTIIEKSGGSPSQPVGRVVYFDVQDEEFICNNFTSVLRLKNPEFDSRYFFWSLFYQHQSGSTLKFQNKTTGIINLQLSRYLEETEIKDFPFFTQKHIASVLDKADALRQQNRQLLAHYDELLQSTFIELFGDPVKNPKGWEVKKVGTLTDIQGGLQVSAGSRNGLPLSLPYLRVANVFRGFLDLSEIKNIELTESELTRVLLKKDDLLVVEGHGNKNEIGRAAIWDDSIKPIVHQNHLIRVRGDLSQISPVFLCFFINSESGKRQLHSSSNTTSGLNTISTGKIKNINLPVPPLPLQQHFAKIVEQIEAQKEAVRQSLTESEALFEGLLAGYFGAS